MSSIEEQLARDIAAVTGGVVMTGSDLEEAREVLDLHIEHRQRRSRRLYAAAAAAALVVAGGVTALALNGDEKAAGPVKPPDQMRPLLDQDVQYLTGAPLTADVLEGVWRVDNGEVALRFDANGRFWYDDGGALFSNGGNQDVLGTYTVEDSLITLTTSRSAEADCIDAKARLNASVPGAGNVRLVLAYDDPVACSPVGYGQQALEQVLPAMPDYASWAAKDSLSEKGWEPLRNPTDLRGLYFSGTHLLELDQDFTGPNRTARGRYSLIAGTGDVVDEGRWSAGAGELTLTSSAESASCSEGDELLLSDVLANDPGWQVFRGTVTKNTCGSPWPTGSWIHVPDSVTG